MLVRLMFGVAKKEVVITDGSKTWSWEETNDTTLSFTVPEGITRIKIWGTMDTAYEPSTNYKATITDTANKIEWASGQSVATPSGGNAYHRNMQGIVGVTPGKTYTLHFDCYALDGTTEVEFSWGAKVNASTPTVEDY